MSLSFNEFQRELQKRNIDPQVAYVFTLLYERLGETMKQVEETANVVLTLAQSVEKMIIMSQADQQTLSQVVRKVGSIGKTDGVKVESVAHDPNDTE